MENPSTIAEAGKSAETSKTARKFNFKMNKRNALIAVILLIVLGGLFFFKGLFIAATVNGMPISRLSVIQELEKNSGQQALDVIITKKLIETEVAKEGISVSDEDVSAEIKTLEAQVVKQGGTLAAALAQQGITEEQFREQLLLQKKLEKLLGDKVAVTDDEVNQYLTQNKTPIPAGVDEADFKNQIRDQLKNQKFNVEADKWITSIKGSAKINYYVDYGKLPAAPIEVPSSSENQ